MSRFCLAIILVLALCSDAEAESPPRQLLGKSIAVMWSENRVQRNVGEEAFRSVTVRHEFRAYVSSAGRVFSRMTNTNPKGRTGSNEQVSGSDSAKRVPTFGTQSMVVMMMGGQGGARRLAVNFDANFGSCVAEVVRGKESGATTMFARSTISGRRVEIQSATASAASCSITAGNVFGGE